MKLSIFLKAFSDSFTETFCRLNTSLELSTVTLTCNSSFITPVTILLISMLAFRLCSANFPISSATTANPLPNSPALAASMDAFKDNRFVWLAIAEIMLVAIEMLSACVVIVSIFDIISSIT